jgi:hypothetical protein
MIYLDRDPRCISPSQQIMLNNENRSHERNATIEEVALWRADALRRLPAFSNRVVLQYDDLFTGVAQIQLCNFLRLEPEAADTMMRCVDPLLQHFKIGLVSQGT